MAGFIGPGGVGEQFLAQRDAVWASLNSAVENGYDFSRWTAQEIAEDLAQYDSQWEDTTIPMLELHAQSWKEQSL